MTALRVLIDVLSLKAFDYVNEETCQRQMADYFDELGIQYQREAKFGTNDRIDFYFPNSGIGLEVKAGKKWSRREVYRQLERYSQHSEIKALILATGRAQGLPEQINDKPVRLHRLGGAHL